MLVYHLAHLCALRYGGTGFVGTCCANGNYDGVTREGGEQKVRPNDNQPQEGHRGERPDSANRCRARGFYMVLLYTKICIGSSDDCLQVFHIHLHT